MSGSPRVAVAVVSYETRELLARCLESLRPDHERGLAEVWVVDNCSTDGSRELVRQRFGWTRLVEPVRNLGFGAAVNEVARRSSRPWLAAANADVAPAAGALEQLLRTGEAEPRTGAVAPRLVLPDGSTQHSVHPFPTLRFALAFNLGLAQLPALGQRLCLEGRWNPDRPREVPWAIGAFLLVRRRAFDEVGGFDPQQWLYAEDLDLGWRLRRAGWETRYEPDAVVRHDASAATALAFGDERVARWQQATYDWVGRRRGRRRARAVAAVNWAGAAARARVFAALAGRDPQRWGAAAARAGEWARVHRRTGLGRRD